jgi:hypothetical protein
VNPVQFYISVAVVPVTTIVIVLIGVLLNAGIVNRRSDDLKDLIKVYAERQDANLSRVEGTMNANLARLENTLNADLSRVEKTLNADLSRMENTLNSDLRRVEETVNANLHRVEDALLSKFAELDTRFSRIEHHLNLG